MSEAIDKLDEAIKILNDAIEELSIKPVMYRKQIYNLQTTVGELCCARKIIENREVE